MDPTADFLAHYAEPEAPELPLPKQRIDRIQIANELFGNEVREGMLTKQALSSHRFVG